MKVAYLIAASGNYDHLRRLVLALADRDRAHFYIHIDAKCAMPETLDDLHNVTFVPRVEVWWGSFSQVEATLSMMREAVKGGYDYYAFISGTDYPVKPVQFLYDILAGGAEFIAMNRGFVSHKPESRVSRYHFQRFDRRAKSPKRYMLLGIEKALGYVVRKRDYPFPAPWTGSSWWTLSHGCVTFILGYVDTHPRYVDFFRTALCPDEMFFQTIVGISPFSGRVRPNLTYTIWNEGQSGPEEISAARLPLFAPDARGEWPAETMDKFFARKFSDASAPVTEKIDAFCSRS